MKSLQTCLTHRSYVATLPWEIQKSHFFLIIIHILQIIYTNNQKKTNSNCYTASLAVYLLLFSAPTICIALVLRLGHATGGAHVLIWTC